MAVTKFGILSITALIPALRNCTDTDMVPLTAESSSMVTLITESADQNSASLSTNMMSLITESTSGTVNNNNDGKV